MKRPLICGTVLLAKRVIMIWRKGEFTSSESFITFLDASQVLKLENIAYRFFFVNPEKCIGCNLCEYACSLEKEGEIIPLKSRIRVVRMNPFISTAMVCKLCDDPPCVTACPTDALSQSQEKRIIRVDEERCDGCGWCIEACPYGAIRYDGDVGAVVICDLCNGKPECKEICPMESIEFLVSNKEMEKKWVSALKFWIDAARKIINITEGKETEVFDESVANKIEEKLSLLLEKQKLHRVKKN